MSDVLSFDGPTPEYSYVTVQDDKGKRRIKVPINYDFSVVEAYDHGPKKLNWTVS